MNQQEIYNDHKCNEKNYEQLELTWGSVVSREQMPWKENMMQKNRQTPIRLFPSTPLIVKATLLTVYKAIISTRTIWLNCLGVTVMLAWRKYELFNYIMQLAYVS